MCFAPQRRALFRHRQLPKVVLTSCVLYILTSKCASCHNGVHFFHIVTSKSGPSMVRFVHFDFDMCFAPEQRTLFRHLNFQKWSEREMFLAFSLANVFCTTRACTFSTSQLPIMVCFARFDLEMCFAPQRRAIFHLSSGQLAALASLVFDPPEPQISGKNTVFRDFPTFPRAWIFFLLTLSLLRSSLCCSSSLL